MKKRDKRAERARELAEWFRGLAGGDDAADLMARTAHALERVASTETPHLASNTVIAAPVAANDNARVLRRRIRR